MIYIFYIVGGIFCLWLVNKLSKPASALTGFAGIVIAMVGQGSGNVQTTLFGLGLFGFSAFVFLVFNGGKW